MKIKVGNYSKYYKYLDNSTQGVSGSFNEQ
jgi:hypothetical protein